MPTASLWGLLGRLDAWLDNGDAFLDQDPLSDIRKLRSDLAAHVVAASTQPPSPQAEVQDCELCDGGRRPFGSTCEPCNGTGIRLERDQARAKGAEEERERLREALGFWEAEHQKVQDGAPGEFDAEERQRARGAVELCQQLRGSLDPSGLGSDVSI